MPPSSPSIARAEEQALDEAEKSAMVFLRLVGSRTTPVNGSKRQAIAASWPEVFVFKFPSDRLVHVNPHDGKVVHYWDNMRLGFHHPSPKPVRSCFSSHDQALKSIHATAQALGIPLNAKLIRADIDLGKPGRAGYRIVSAEFA